MSWIDELVEDRSDKTKVYIAWAGEVEFMGASESDSSGRRVKLRLVRPPESANQVHPFAKHTRRRRGHVGSRFVMSVAEIDGPREMMLEVGLVNWADTPRGSTVDFVLDSTDSHPFMHDRRASKDMSGTRYMATFVEKADDESLVRQDKIERLEKAARSGRHQSLSNVARLLTKHKRFHEWLREVEEDVEWTTQDADDWLKDKCGIASKAELDDESTPEGARKIIRFHKIRSAFVDWQEAQGFDDDR